MRRIGDLERQYVEEVLASEFRASAGHVMATRLEQAFAKLTGRKYAIAMCNGTATLHAALVAAGVGPGDEVIVPPLTMASTTFAVLHAGATPVYADVDMGTWTLDPHAVRDKITPRTKAVIPVSLYGMSADVQSISNVTWNHDITIIEDAAQSIHSSLYATASSFSFQSSKLLTSGEGGMVVTDDKDHAERVRRLSSLGYAAVGADSGMINKLDIQDPDYIRHVDTGYNYRMPELCAAVALAQVDRVKELTYERLHTASHLLAVTRGCEWLRPQLERRAHSYWTVAFVLEEPGPTWHQLRDEFNAQGGEGVYGAWRLTYQEPVFEEYVGSCPVAEYLQPRIMQFKTNCYKRAEAHHQAECLARAIKVLNG